MENKILCTTRLECGNEDCVHAKPHIWEMTCNGTCYRLVRDTTNMTEEEILKLPKAKCELVAEIKKGGKKK